MGLRRDLYLGIGVLVGLHILVSFGAIGLFSRMTPAIQKILQENVYSIESAEELFSLIALAGTETPVPQKRQRFRWALDRMRRNVTEVEENPEIEILEANGLAALEGDLSATVVSVEALRRLVAINRKAMRQVDERAQSLGRAGGWAVAFLALAGFAASLIVLNRMRKRVLEPLEELSDTLHAVQMGDHHRRCQARVAPEDARRILDAVNELLDLRHRSSSAPV